MIIFQKSLKKERIPDRMYIVNLFDTKQAKIIMGGKEHVAITKKEAEEFYKSAYQTGFDAGYQAAFEKFYWDDGK